MREGERDRGKKVSPGTSVKQSSQRERERERERDSVHPSRWERNDREGTKDVIQQMDNWWVFSLFSLSSSVFLFSPLLVACLFAPSLCLWKVFVWMTTIRSCVWCAKVGGGGRCGYFRNSLKMANFGGDQRANRDVWSTESLKHVIGRD